MALDHSHPYVYSLEERIGDAERLSSYPHPIIRARAVIIWLLG